MGKGFDIRSFMFDPQHSHFLTVWAWQVKEFFQVTVSSSVKLEVVGEGHGVLPFAFFWTHGPIADLFTNAFNLILSCSLNKVLVTNRVPQKQTWDKKSYEVTHQGTRRDLEGNEGDRAEREEVKQGSTFEQRLSLTWSHTWTLEPNLLLQVCSS